MTLDRQNSQELERSVESVAQLVDHLRAGEKPPDRWRIGMEHEKLGVRADTLEPVPYAGEGGIESLLRRIADLDAWKEFAEHGHVVGLHKEAAGISLEPGGQVELNGTPARTVHEVLAEGGNHLASLHRVGDRFGIAWLGLGLHPLCEVDSMPRVPRDRYRIMRGYLPSRGELALEMMHCTASVQVSFDYSDEDDLVEKMRTALSVTPIVGALFANSSIARGGPSGFASRRIHVWRHTDPDRTGLLPFVCEDGFGYERYVDWALDVPMFFIVRNGRYLPMDGKTFRSFLDTGHGGERATLADFDRHLTTLFPEVRVKQILEVRCADAVPADLLGCVPALWKGILYEADARREAALRAGRWSAEEREAVLEEAARRGLAAQTPDGPLLDAARALVAIAREGLRRLDHRDEEGHDERRFLEPLDALLERGRSPGQLVLERWEGEWRRSLDRLIEYVRY